MREGIGFPGGSEVKVSASNAGDVGLIPGFDPWVGKIPWRRKWQSILVFLPGESRGRRNLVGYRPRGCKGLDMTEQLHFHLSAHLRLLISLPAVLISSLCFILHDVLCIYKLNKQGDNIQP